MKSPKKLTFIINASLSSALSSAVSLYRDRYGNNVTVSLFSAHDIEEGAISTQTLEHALRSADMVFLDIRGDGKAVGVCERVLAKTQTPVALLIGGSPRMMSLLRLGTFSMKKIMQRSARRSKKKNTGGFSISRAQRMMKIIERVGTFLPFGPLKHARNWALFMQYWGHSGDENICNMLALALREYCGVALRKPPRPRAYPDFGIYDPLSDRTWSSLESYQQDAGHDTGKPAIGILFYGGMHFEQSIVPAKEYTRRLREKGCNVIPAFSTAPHNLAAIKTLFMRGDAPVVDALVYIQWFQLSTFGDSPQRDTIALLKRLGVPVFMTCPMFGREIEKWRESVQGMSPVESLTTIILPEVDGMIEPLPSCGLVETQSDAVEGKVKHVVAIDDRIERSCNRILNWVALRRKPNTSKRVAFIVYDNPPGEDNLGSAAYLDTFASLKNLLKVMKERGYDIGEGPGDTPLHEQLLSRHCVNSPRWGAAEDALRTTYAIDSRKYAELSRAISAAKDVDSEWGPAPGKIMSADGRLVLPALTFGNVLLGVQPARGYHSDPDKTTHDQTLPPHHQYVAFYRWLASEWKPDCIVHVGTHGTLEFLKGKEMGMSAECFPENLIGDTPHLYYYHVVNASEATIAKRRSLGTLVNYNSPSFAAGGLYESWQALDELIAEFLEARALEPSRAARLEKRILELALENNIGAADVAAIQEEIGMMKRSVIPKGLHILGNDIPLDDRIAFAVFYLRSDHAAHASLHRLLSRKRGLDYEALLCPSKATEGLNNTLPRALEEIEHDVEGIVREAISNGIYPADDEESSAVQAAIDAAGKLTGTDEIENFFVGLDGRYIEPGIGGDPLRNPEVLPTGRNSFQFDPRRVPSEEAVKRGAEIAGNTLQHYYDLHKKWPNSTAVILWGFETTKTRGETVGQVLAYLGVRIKAGSNPYFKQLEVVPIEQLGRPRVDCVVQICGFFRDMFPNVMEMIDRAFQLVSQLDETTEDNPVRGNTERIADTIRGTVPEENLTVIASGRIFGPRAGEYGTRTTNLIETGAWQSEEEIAGLFTSTMSHLYAGNIHGERNLDAYRGRLERVDVVSQVRDSHEYEIMDLDHYYEFFGGLSRTVESIRGEAPEMLISDTTKEIIRTETVKESLNRGIRTRLLNPKWIDELLKHDFHGAQKISDRVEYLIGFAATTHAVDDWVFSAVTDRYIRDETMFNRISRNNRFAAEETIKRLFEADSRGYWDASEEQRALLRDRMLQLEGDIEEAME